MALWRRARRGAAIAVAYALLFLLLVLLRAALGG
jgi:hypothetical protein